MALILASYIFHSLRKNCHFSKPVFTCFNPFYFYTLFLPPLASLYSFLTPRFPTFQPSVTPCHYPPELLVRGQVFRQDRITQCTNGPGCMHPLAGSAVCPGHLSICVASAHNFFFLWSKLKVTFWSLWITLKTEWLCTLNIPREANLLIFEKVTRYCSDSYLNLRN